MEHTDSPTTDKAEKFLRLVGGFALASAVVTSVFTILTINKHLRVGWPASHPWSTAASILNPIMLMFLGLTMLSTGSRRRIFAGVCLVICIGEIVCGVLALAT